MRQDQAQTSQPAQVPANPVSSASQPNPTLATNYAGFGERLVAVIIDSFILSVVNFVIFLVFISLFGISAANTISFDPYQDPTQSQSVGFAIFGFTMIMWVVQTSIYVGYFTFTDVKYGQTLGKKVLGLRVADTSGHNLSIGKALLRESVGRWISGLVFGLGYLWVVFDEKKQGWHDKIANTYVIKS